VGAVTDVDRARQLDAIEADLADVEHALARLEAGSYETCEVCAGAIEVDVLVVTPAARRCVTCATPPATSVWAGPPVGTPMPTPPKEASHGWNVR
jgi:hypothetical protein